MPSRPVVVGILLFWLGVLGLVARRELLPRLFADAPPAPEFVLADELSQATVHWAVLRGKPGDPADERVGGLSTRTEHVKEDDSFRLVTGYRGVRLTAAGGVVLSVPQATVTARVARDGRLLEQTAHGSADLDLGGPLGKLSVTADVRAVVKDGVLAGTATLTAPGLLAEPTTRPLDPVPVPDGQVLNPMLPTDRLRGVAPGRRWVVRQVDPLRDALARLGAEAFAQATGGKAGAVSLPPSPELVAEVLAAPEELARRGRPVSCWVIEYRANGELVARTWVERDDGRVLRQEATAHGERMRFEREE